MHSPRGEFVDLWSYPTANSFYLRFSFFSRSSLTKQAEKESVDLFMMNLYRLLLTPPIRGKNVLGLDPGFSHGCKLAVLGSTGAWTKQCCNVIWNVNENLVYCADHDKWNGLKEKYSFALHNRRGSGDKCHLSIWEESKCCTSQKHGSRTCVKAQVIWISSSNHVQKQNNFEICLWHCQKSYSIYYNEVIYALAPTNHIVVSVLKYAVLEWFSIEYRKSKTKQITCP